MLAVAFIYVTAEIMPAVHRRPSPTSCQRSHGRDTAGQLCVGGGAVDGATGALDRTPAAAADAAFDPDSPTASSADFGAGADFRGAGCRPVLCALTHGLMWSVVAPIGARLVPATHAARATTAVYVGTGFALVVGSPLTAALEPMWGWRPAVAITAAAAVVLVAARFTLPPMATTAYIALTGGARDTLFKDIGNSQRFLRLRRNQRISKPC